MEFGYFAQAFVPNFEVEVEPGAEHRRLMENLEFAVECDKNGIKYVWCPEHHFLTEYSHMPAPEVFLSFVAAPTGATPAGPPTTTPRRRGTHRAASASRGTLSNHLPEAASGLETGGGA